MKISTLFCSALLALAPVAAYACPAHEAAAKTTATQVSAEAAKKCCEGGKCAPAASGIKAIELSVAKIHCGGCAKGIEAALTKLAGVKSIATNVNAKKVTVSYQGAKVSRYAILEQLKRAGYPATPVVETHAHAKMTDKAATNEVKACCKKP